MRRVQVSQDDTDRMRRLPKHLNPGIDRAEPDGLPVDFFRDHPQLDPQGDRPKDGGRRPDRIREECLIGKTRGAAGFRNRTCR